MKKLIALVLFVGATLSFTACSSDDNTEFRVDAKVEGTWSADRLYYKLGETDMDHKYTDMPGENAVSKPDELVLKQDKAILTEYFKSKDTPTVTEGTITGKIITFNKEGYTPRTINGVVNGQLSLTYNITMRGATLPVTVTYNAGK